jgi:hypothetical protein
MFSGEFDSNNPQHLLLAASELRIKARRLEAQAESLVPLEESAASDPVGPHEGCTVVASGCIFFASVTPPF